MNRYFVPIVATTLAALVFSCSCTRPAKTVAAIERTFGTCPSNVEFIPVPKTDSCDFYALSVNNNVLTVEGTSEVALCKGFHDYILENGYGIISWSGNRLDFPSELEDMPRQEVHSPFVRHLFFNVCTFGYTAPFWDWPRWEKEIDWLSFHGFDMPLAPVAYEAIMSRVLLEQGLTREEIDNYFSGPAHLPWMRMGNLSNIDGGMSREWHDSQIALQHKILDRMREMGMEPVIQGFAGFVPDALERHFPGRGYVHTDWHTLSATYLPPTDSLFAVIGSSFVREWEKEFGPCKYYLMDSFNEMKLPFAPIGEPSRYTDLKHYSECIYESMATSNPDAVWVMQGWMFGRNRDIWEPRSVEALLSGAPKGKLVVVDLAVDFNHFQWRNGTSWDTFSGFYGTPWIWSTTPNFGGRNNLKGVLDFYLNEHLTALSSPNRGSLWGYGSSPEGIEGNEVIYELMSSAGWSSEHKDTDEFLRKYSRARYGVEIEGAGEFWSELRRSVYGSFTGNDVLQIQRPPMHHYQPCTNINPNCFKGLEAFFKNAREYAGNELYRTDAIQYAAFYLVFKAEVLLSKVNRLIGEGRSAEASQTQKVLIDMLLDADRLLESHPVFRLARWEEFASNAGTSPAEKDKFVEEARHLVTTWGGNGIRDYSARIWSGLIRDYYVPRLQRYFDAVNRFEYVDLKKYDEEFRFNRTSVIEPFDNPFEAALSLVEKYSGVDIREAEEYEDAWCSQDFPDSGPVRMDYYCHSENIDGLKSMEFEATHGSVTIKQVEIRNRWTPIKTVCPDASLKAGEKVSVDFDFPSKVEGKAQIVYIFITYENADHACGVIRFKH